MVKCARILLGLELLGQDLRTGSRGVIAQKVGDGHAHAPEGFGRNAFAGAYIRREIIE